MKSRVLILIVPLLAAVVSMAFFFLALHLDWFGEPGYTALLFCESVRDAPIRQPANTWSNLGFLAAGLLMAWELARQKYIRHANRLTRTLFFPAFLSVLTVLLCPGSMAMHATTSLVGGYFDMLSMYLLASFMFAYAFIRFFGQSEKIFFLFFLLSLGICHWVHFQERPVFSLVDGTVVFGVFVGMAAVLEFLQVYVRRVLIRRKWGVLSAASFALAFLIWDFSKTGHVLCVPDSWLQGHAAWHLLDAAALFSLFRFYVSEHDPLLEAAAVKAI